ncbi:MAG TPA: universal stress protein, partial [Nannocystis sp.]
AAAVGRPLELIHVGQAHDGDMLGALDPRWKIEHEGHRAEVLAAVNAWTFEHSLGDCPRRVLFGEPVAEIAGAAAELHAALVVVGSRQLGVGARIFTTSTASALAGVAGCAVAVVPPA